MEKLSDRIHTLVPRKADKLKADLIDILIYLLTLIPIVHIYTPLYGKEEYNWFRAVILGSLLFIVLNYFIRYFIPSKFNGQSLGKLLFGIKTVDYYGYEAKPNQLLLKESIYIFFPILSFSKFTDINYILIGLWLLVFLKSFFNAYLLSGFSNNQTRKQAKKLLKNSVEELTDEIAENAGLNIFVKTKELYKAHRLEVKEITSNYKNELKELKETQKEALGKISKENKQERYDVELKQKLDREALQNTFKKEHNELTDNYNHELFELEKQETLKLEETIQGFKDEEIQEDERISAKRSFADIIKAQNNKIQNRSVMDLRANTVVVDKYKFDKFFEEHRTEE